MCGLSVKGNKKGYCMLQGRSREWWQRTAREIAGYVVFFKETQMAFR